MSASIPEKLVFFFRGYTYDWESMDDVEVEDIFVYLIGPDMFEDGLKQELTMLQKAKDRFAVLKATSIHVTHWKNDLEYGRVPVNLNFDQGIDMLIEIDKQYFKD